MSGQRVGAALPARAWHTLMHVEHTGNGPLCLRSTPFLAAGDIGADGHPRSSIMFPTHLRSAVRASFGLPSGDLMAEGHGPGHPAEDSAAPVDVLRRDLGRFDGLPALRASQVLCCLNMLSEQGVVQALLPDLAPLGPRPSSPEARVWYEAGRGLVRHPGTEDAGVRTLRDVVDVAPPRVAAAAAIQLGAYEIRLAGDLTSAAEYVALAGEEIRQCERDGSTPGSETALLMSRWHRLTALHRARLRDSDGVRQAMRRAEDSSRALLAETGVHPYQRLLAEENHKIVAEASIKAAHVGRDLSSLTTWVTELVALDPEDPTTWRCVAEACASTGMVSTARLAMLGQVALGGPGAHQTLALLDSAEPGPEENGDTAAAIGDVLTTALTRFWT